MNNKIYSKTYKVQSFLVGATAELHPSALTVIMQEMGAVQSQFFGVSGPQLWKQGVGWVISRTQVVIHRLPHIEEDIQLSTWIREPKGFYVTRDVEAKDSDGKILFQGCNYWIPIHIETRRPQRAHQFTGGVEPLSEEEALGIYPQKVPPVAEPFHTLKLPVMVRDFDSNKHVTNGVYWDWIVEAVDRLDTNFTKVKDVTINYLKEIPYPARDVCIITSQQKEGHFIHSIQNIEGTEEFAKAMSIWEC